MTDFNIVTATESRRTTNQEIRTLYLYPEGNFMRAFEWSAWLWCKYIKEFKAIRRKIKDTGGTIVQIGCPIASFAGHIPKAPRSRRVIFFAIFLKTIYLCAKHFKAQILWLSHLTT